MKTYQGDINVIELHEDHLVIRRGEGKMAVALGGDTRAIPLTALRGVTLKPATRMQTGYVHLQLGGEPPSDSRNHPDTIAFTRKRSAEFEELAQLLLLRVAENVAQGVDSTAIEFDRGKTRRENLKEHERRGEERKRNSFAGITLHEDRLESKDGGGPIAGARAIVDTAR